VESSDFSDSAGGRSVFGFGCAGKKDVEEHADEVADDDAGRGESEQGLYVIQTEHSAQGERCRQSHRAERETDNESFSQASPPVRNYKRIIGGSWYASDKVFVYNGI
jgi:hypothetical protein